MYKFTIQNKEVVFHMNCFYCFICGHRFLAGDRVAILCHKKLLCMNDYAYRIIVQPDKMALK